MKRLFLFLIIPFVIGILASYSLDLDIKMIICLIILSLFGLIFSCIFNKGYAIVLCIMFLFLGSIMGAKSLESSLVDFVGEELILEGIIESRTLPSEDKSAYIIKVNKFIHEDSTFKIQEKILLNFYDKQIFNVSDEIRVKGVLLLPKENTNPRLFNYRLYLQTKNIHTTLNANGTSVDIISKGESGKGRLLKLKFQERISAVLNETLNEKNSRIMGSIILGDSSFLDDETGTRFRELGLSHILAVSGLHIGIIYLFISKTLRLLGVHKRISIIISLIIIWSYGFLIGFPASVLRASIMFSALSLSSLVYRRYDSINTLSLAALFLLFIRPLWIFDVGFQLSFIATASIIIFTPRISWLLSIYNKKIARLISVLVAVQIGLLPVQAYHFNSYVVLSLISNLILIPVFSFSLILCFVLILISLIFMNISIMLGFLLNAILDIAGLIIDILYRLSFVNISLPSFGIVYILIYYFLMLICFRVIKIDLFKPNINRLIFNYLIIVLIISFITYIAINETILEFIDVGQGDSCLVSTKNKTFLVDTGGNVFGDFDVGERIVLPYLLKKGINKLDAVFITHFHEDHAEGLISLFNNIKIENIFIGYENEESALFNKIIYNAKKLNIKVSIISEGDLIHIDKNNVIEILNPLNSLSAYDLSNENNLSLVFVLDSHGKKVLFTGDMEKETEHRIVNSVELSKIDILKVPHHGSSTSSGQELVDRIKPAYAVIQVGKNNFGHPDKEVLERYEKVDAKIFRNDENGLITFIIDKEGIEIYTYIANKATLNDIIVKCRYELLYMIIYAAASFFLCITYGGCSSLEELQSNDIFNIYRP